MVHVYQVYSTIGAVKTGGGVVTDEAVAEATSDTIAVAIGEVPSGQVLGGMT
jgi:hypothetical protein